MKGIGRSLLGVVLVLSVGLTLVHGQRTSRDSAWEKLLQSDPAAADDPSIGWRERLILHVLTAEQADHYFRTGADPKSLLIDSGQTLQEYLDSRLNPPAAGYVALPVPCPVFASDRLEAGLRYGVRVRGGDLSLQGGSATGCGIPAEAKAVILSVKLEDPIPGTRLKMWAADGPEPAEAVLDVAQGLDPAFQKTVVLTLAEDRPEGDLLLQTVVPAAARAEVTGYFRALRTDDAPGGGVSFYTEGAVNNFFGTDAGASITSGTSNSFFGTAAGTSNTTGSDNTFFGHNAGYSNTGGGSNSFFGRGSGYSNTLGLFNNFFGVGAGFTNTTGSWNSFFGPNAGYSNTEGYSNAFFGEGAGYSNTTGFNSNFFGTWAGYLNTEGQLNSFFGSYAGASNTVESHNTLVGAFSDLNPGSSPETSPVENATALGYRSYVSRSNSLVLGSIAGLNGATDIVNVGIGTPAPERQLHLNGRNAVFRMDRDIDTAAFIMLRTSASGAPWKAFVVGTNASGPNNGEFIINDTGQSAGGAGLRRMTITNTGETHFTGTVRAPEFVPTSSLRFKENVETLHNAADTLARLRGVSFNWKKTGKPSVGLIAEEVAEVIPEVVDWEEDGSHAAGVNYSALVAVLVEAIKDQQEEIDAQRQKLETHQATIAVLQAGMVAVEDLKTEVRQLRTQLLSSASMPNVGTADAGPINSGTD